MIPGLCYFQKNKEISSLSEDIQNYLFSGDGLEKMETVSETITSRKVIHFGYTYPYSKKSNVLEKAEDMPECILSLRKTIKSIWKEAPENIEERMNQCIINIYEPGQGISAHIDDVKLFGDIIACFTFFSSREITFSKGKEKYNILTEPDSLYVLTGDARYLYKHEMKKRKKDNGILRGRVVSITFREYAF